MYDGYPLVDQQGSKDIITLRFDRWDAGALYYDPILTWANAPGTTSAEANSADDDDEFDNVAEGLITVAALAAFGVVLVLVGVRRGGAKRGVEKQLKMNSV
jgi:hypothetical protein